MSRGITRFIPIGPYTVDRSDPFGWIPDPPGYVAERKKEIMRDSPKLKTHPSEHQEQAAVVQWWGLQCNRYGLPDFALFAIPNAGAGAQKGQAGKMKAEGVRPGVPDLCLSVPRGTFHGLYIEMKSFAGNLRPSQRNVAAWLQGQGYAVEVCYSAEAAVRAIREYLA